MKKQVAQRVQKYPLISQLQALQILKNGDEVEVSLVSAELYKVKNNFSRSFFQKIIPLCVVSIQEWFVIKSWL